MEPSAFESELVHWHIYQNLGVLCQFALALSTHLLRRQSLSHDLMTGYCAMCRVSMNMLSIPFIFDVFM